MQTQDPGVDNYLHLLGLPPLRDYVRFVRTKSAEPGRADDKLLAEQWRRSQRRIEEIRSTQQGLADDIELAALPADMKEIADRALSSATVQRVVQYLPRRWCFVEIDRLVVYQRIINLRFVAEIKAEFPSVVNNEQLIRMAIGEKQRQPPVRYVKGDDGSLYFSSSSNDLQFLDVVPLSPSAISDYQPPGYASSAVVVYVGFGMNFINTFRANGRLILTNGYHRVYALREMGVTHVPCLVGEATRDEDFELVVPSEVQQNRSLYLTGPRPPLVRDYFDPDLCAMVRTVRRNRLLQLELGLNRLDIPAV